jgi:hypothetical protein
MGKAWIFLIIVISIGSCKTISNQKGVINELRISLPRTPNCATIAFKVETKDAEFKDIITKEAKYNVEIYGAFFNDSTFYMGKPEINFFEDNTCLITSGSCYFIDRDQNELDLIANNALKEVTIVVTCNKTKWVFKGK